MISNAGHDRRGSAAGGLAAAPGRAAAAAALALIFGLPPATAGQPVTAGNERRSPIVEVVEATVPAVVNIATDQRLDNPFGGSGSSPRDFFEGPRRGPEKRFVQNSLGSGVLVRPEGFVVTNEHVILGASRIRVTLADGRTVLADVVGTDSESDLAVLRLNAEGTFPYVRLGHSADLMIGETVIAIGNPFGFSSSVTTGVVSAAGRTIESGDRLYTDYIQTDALINPGNSGGPLLNIQAELIGVNNAVYGPAQGIGFAIPVDRVRRVVEDLIDFGEVRHPWLGFLVEEVATGDRERIGLGETRALRIQRLFLGSPADQAGLKAGDIISSVGGRRTGSRGDLDTVLSETAAGVVLQVAAERDGERVDVVVRTAPFPEAKAMAYFAEVTGLTLESIPAGLRSRHPFLPERGLLVTAVRGSSRAQRLGLKEGDVVVRLGSDAVSGEGDLRRLAGSLLTRAGFYMVVVRGREAYNLTFPVM